MKNKIKFDWKLNLAKKGTNLNEIYENRKNTKIAPPVRIHEISAKFDQNSSKSTKVLFIKFSLFFQIFRLFAKKKNVSHFSFEIDAFLCLINNYLLEITY